MSAPTAFAGVAVLLALLADAAAPRPAAGAAGAGSGSAGEGQTVALREAAGQLTDVEKVVPAASAPAGVALLVK